MFDRRLLSNFDGFFFSLFMIITALGVLAIHSAEQGYDTASSFWVRQAIWILISFLALVILLAVDYQWLASWSWILHGCILLPLVYLEFYGQGQSVNRWLVLGPVAIQPSEFVKVTTVLVAANCLSTSRPWGLPRRHLTAAFAVALPFFLIVRQPDLGTALLLVLNHLPMALLLGLRRKALISILVGGILFLLAFTASFNFGYYGLDAQLLQKTRHEQLAGPSQTAVETLQGSWFFLKQNLYQALLEAGGETPGEKDWEFIAQESFVPFINHLLLPYQKRRLLNFLYPENDPLGTGYHVIQSKIAIGSGEILGKGYLNSTQGHLNFLPARHTDFLFAIFAEEFGFFGGGILIMLYGLFITRGFYIIFHTYDRLGAFIVLGMLSIVTTQVLINLGMVLGLLPVVGVPLPFFSYGGSALLTAFIVAGMILNVHMRRFFWVRP